MFKLCLWYQNHLSNSIANSYLWYSLRSLKLSHFLRMPSRLAQLWGVGRLVLHICLIPPHILLCNASYAVGMLHGALHRFIAFHAALSKFGLEFRLSASRCTEFNAYASALRQSLF